MEVPISKLDITGGIAANRLVWTPDGRGVITGDIKGNIQMCDVASDISIPEHADWDKLSARLADLTNS